MSAVLLLTDPDTADQGTVSTFLQSRIHKSFTDAADDLYAMGLLTTEERIAISGCIGDALSVFTDIMAEKVPDAASIEVPMEVAQEILCNALLLVAEHAKDKCMKCAKTPAYEISWADGRAHAWFCENHLKEFINEEPGRKDGSDIPEIKELSEGKAHKHTGENPNPNVKGRFIKSLKIKTANELETAWIYAFAVGLITLAKSGPCEKCKDPSDKLEKHRMKPGWQGGEYVEDNIKLLCPECHKKVHQAEGTFEMGGEWRHEHLVKDLGQEGYSAWQSDRGKERQQKLKDELGDDGYSSYQRETALKRWHPDWFDKDGNRIKDDDGNPIAKAAAANIPKTLAVDLDDTILSYENGWQGPTVFGTPLPGAKETLEKLKAEGWFIMINTCRSEIPLIVQHLTLHDIPFDAVNENPNQPDTINPNKPYADYRIDDTAIHFDGDWKSIYDEIQRRERMKKVTGQVLIAKRSLALRKNKHFSFEILAAERAVDESIMSLLHKRFQLAGLENSDRWLQFGASICDNNSRTLIVAHDLSEFAKSNDLPDIMDVTETLGLFDALAQIIYKDHDRVSIDFVEPEILAQFKQASISSNWEPRENVRIIFRDAQGVYDPASGILYNNNNIQNLWTTQPQDYSDPAYWGTPTKLKKIHKDKQKEEEEKLKALETEKREGSVLDFPRNTLDPAIWEYLEDSELPRLRQDVKYTIRETFLDWARHDMGIDDDSALWLKALYFIGSAATNQWRETSDIDITVVINEELVAQYIGDICNISALGDVSSCFGAAAAEVLNGYMIAQHPVNYWMQPEEKPIDTADAIYNLETDVWIKPPPELPEGFDPSERFAHIRAEAILWARSFDLSINELRRDIADYMDVDEHLGHVDGPLRDMLVKRLNAKGQSIESRTRQILKDFLKIKEQRTRAFETPLDVADPSYISRNWAPAALIYKWLERYGYLDLVKKILHVYKVKPEGINSIEAILALQEVIT